MADAAHERVGPPSLSEWMASYDDQPSEVIDGEIAPMQPPDFVHSWITNELGYQLQAFVRTHKLGRVFIETATLIDASESDDWVKGSFVPDVFFVEQARLDAFMESYSGKGPLRLAPALAAEVVSANDSYSMLNRKIAQYLEHGVRLVWIIDPATRTIRIHTSDDPDGHTIDDQATLDGGEALPGWSMAVNDLLNVPGMK